VIQVKILLTRYRGEQMIQQANAAKEAVKEFYSLDPMIQQQTAPFFRMFIKALDISVDADTTITPMPLMTAPTQGTDVAAATEATRSKPSGKPEPNL